MKNEEQPQEQICWDPVSAKLPLHFRYVKRCGAKTKTKGTPCMSPAMKNGRCRFHGGKSPGPPIGNKNAWKHGLYSRESTGLRRQVKDLLQKANELVTLVDQTKTTPTA